MFKRKRKTSDIAPTHTPFESLYRLPWWLVMLILGWVLVVVQILANPVYSRIFDELRIGISLTLYMAIAAYALALLFGLLVGLVRSYRPQSPGPDARPFKVIWHILYTALYNMLSLYVEFMRGIPPLVFLLIVGFIVVPAVSPPIQDFLNAVVVPPLQQISRAIGLEYTLIFGNGLEQDMVWRGRDPATAIAGLGLVYGAFLSEVFRSGIQSIPKGQMEAGKSLGMSFLQVMRLIIIPQAVRRILPELGNNFISMIKDTSLVTILGTNEITQIARKWSGSTFQYLETYLVLSLIYLTLTVSGSLVVQTLERRLKRHER